MKTLVVLPSYNESDNIIKIINKILFQSKDNYVVVVDDNSSDNTAEIVKNFININEYNNRIHLIKRNNKLGRGSAVLEGFKWGYSNYKNIDIFIEMDCDFSHSPKEIYKGKELIKKYDFIIGARYPNGKIINWSLNRKIFSFISNQLIRILIDRRIADYTNGFRFYSKKTVEYLLNKQFMSSGYICLSEIAAILLKANFSSASFSITFKNRVRGKSNVNLKEIINSFILIIKISWCYRFGKFKNNF